MSADGVLCHYLRIYTSVCAGDVATLLFNPTLSPFKVPLVLSAFLMGIWLFIVVLLAVLDDLFRQLSPAAAVFYLLGLASCCIFCYFSLS